MKKQIHKILYILSNKEICLLINFSPSGVQVKRKYKNYLSTNPVKNAILWMDPIWNKNIIRQDLHNFLD